MVAQSQDLATDKETKESQVPMTTRQFLAALLALAVAPWKALSKAKPVPRFRLGKRVYPPRYGNFVGLIVVDRRREGEQWLVERPLRDWETWEEQEICNYRRDKFVGLELNSGKKAILCLDFPEDVEFYGVEL